MTYNQELKSATDNSAKEKLSMTSWTTEELSEKLYRRAINLVGKEQGFRFEELLAFGSNGAVAKMFNQYSKKEIAVKVEPFRDEDVIACWMEIEHPNIVSLIAHIPLKNSDIYDTEDCQEEEYNYEWTAYIMPLCQSDLSSKLACAHFRSSPCSFQIVSQWFIEIVDALHYLHKNQMYHLDLKPDNVLLGTSGQVKLADFTFLTNRRLVDVQSVGCPLTLQPPETLRPSLKAGLVDAEKVDIWCLGLLIACLLTGGEAFENLEQLEERENEAAVFYFLSQRQTLMHQLQEPENLKLCISRVYPKAKLDDKIIKSLSDFMELIVKVNPSKRPTTKELRYHPFILQMESGRLIRHASKTFLNLDKDIAKELSLHWWEPSAF